MLVDKCSSNMHPKAKNMKNVFWSFAIDWKKWTKFFYREIMYGNSNEVFCI